jgi:hypothetical protein
MKKPAVMGATFLKARDLPQANTPGASPVSFL